MRRSARGGPKDRARQNRWTRGPRGLNGEEGRGGGGGRRRCMRKNFTREPANPRERFASSARLPAASVSCAISYAALGEGDDCAAGRSSASCRFAAAPRESVSPPSGDTFRSTIARGTRLGVHVACVRRRHDRIRSDPVYATRLAIGPRIESRGIIRGVSSDGAIISTDRAKRRAKRYF